MLTAVRFRIDTHTPLSNYEFKVRRLFTSINMPFGTLKTTPNAAPLFAPSYPQLTNPPDFFIRKLVGFNYRVAASQVHHLVPDVLELEDTPLMSTVILEYEMSPIASYNELIHQVEVKYKGERFMFCIILVLDNEAAVFGGREQFGFPKVLGKADITSVSGSAFIEGSVERPAGRKVIEVEFLPRASVAILPLPEPWWLGIRTIPSLPGTAPSIQELVPMKMTFKAEKVWTGEGHVAFSKSTAFNPWLSLDILRYESSYYALNATAVLEGRNESFQL
ncbi:Decarboxylase DEC1 [Colletotrichum tanaceti]|uniref:Decarboxylase DEC1 n=1 Tax=Colletotrichum tanaceti TaxID=1306861 RepID=A0A4U6XHQ0_9PEZI|nr:Decarboxylase DEC1 [Colletotrichum tanaceti]